MGGVYSFFFSLLFFSALLSCYRTMIADFSLEEKIQPGHAHLRANTWAEGDCGVSVTPFRRWDT